MATHVRYPVNLTPGHDHLAKEFAAPTALFPGLVAPMPGRDVATQTQASTTAFAIHPSFSAPAGESDASPVIPPMLRNTRVVAQRHRIFIFSSLQRPVASHRGEHVAPMEGPAGCTAGRGYYFVAILLHGDTSTCPIVSSLQHHQLEKFKVVSPTALFGASLLFGTMLGGQTVARQPSISVQQYCLHS